MSIRHPFVAAPTRPVHRLGANATSACYFVLFTFLKGSESKVECIGPSAGGSASQMPGAAPGPVDRSVPASNNSANLEIIHNSQAARPAQLGSRRLTQ